MLDASRSRAFTLIELLTVIAIIAVLAALLFPLAGTVREQARSSNCMSNLHQLWVAASVYKQDEGEYPDALMGYAMTEIQDPNDPTQIIQVPYTGGNATLVPFTRMEGMLYPDMIRDSYGFRCPDVATSSPTAVTVAYYPPNPPAGWADRNGNAYDWIGTHLAAAGCPSDSNGVVDCFTSGPYAGSPKYFYVWDAYDVTPRIDASGSAVRDADGNYIYDRAYSVDWTGVKGLNDLPEQLKYAQPQSDKTLLTHCNWHAARAGAGSVTAISLAGTARKINAREMVEKGPNVFNR
jgi:prepilin-type N-terminal cleavage/methylation domain-containing protein